MTARFSRQVLAAIHQCRVLGIRAGGNSNHRFIGIWAVVIDGRVFARSWTRKAGGWYRTLLIDPRGSIQVGVRTIAIRARSVPSERIRDAVERGYADKYPTAGSRKFVRGFRSKRRRDSTLEFMPR